MRISTTESAGTENRAIDSVIVPLPESQFVPRGFSARVRRRDCEQEEERLDRGQENEIGGTEGGEARYRGFGNPCHQNGIVARLEVEIHLLLNDAMTSCYAQL